MILALVLLIDVGSGIPKKTGPIKIAVVQAGDSHATCVQRLERALGVKVDTIPVDSKIEILRKYDVVVFGSSWAQCNWKEISERRQDYAEFVRRGGGVLMFQPNPHQFPNDELEIDLLPATYRVNNWYNDSGVKREGAHPITEKLADRDMPYPADRIIEHSREWKVLARGTDSGGASLIVARIGRGRAAVDADHHLRDVPSSQWHSNELLRRLVTWLAGR